MERGLSTVEALRAHLFEQLIPAVLRGRDPSRVTAEPLRPRREWDPEKARRWLGMLASQFSGAGTPERSGDIAWWRLGAHVFDRRAVTLAAGLGFGSAFAVVGGLSGGLVGGIGFGVACAVMSGLVAGVCIASAAGLWEVDALSKDGFLKYWLDEEPTYAYLRLRGRVRRLVLLIAGAVPITVSIALICGLVGGLGIGLIGGSGLVHGAVIGVLVGTVLGATAGL